ncbi:MAG: TadE family protein [Acidimicrobiia bacterium]
MRARLRTDKGASLVEFALVLPIFMGLVLAMFTGGLAYTVRQAITQGARESARAAATTPVTTTVNAWLDDIATVAERSADGELATGEPGRYLCVALIRNGVVSRRETVGNATSYTTGTPCFDDGLSVASSRRVQVLARRTREMEAIFFSNTLDLEGRAVARYEIP